MFSYFFSISPMELLPKWNQVWVFTMLEKTSLWILKWGDGLLFVCFIYFGFNFFLYKYFQWRKQVWSSNDGSFELRLKLNWKCWEQACLSFSKKLQHHLQLIKISTNISKIFKETCGQASTNLDRIRALVA